MKRDIDGMSSRTFEANRMNMPYNNILALSGQEVIYCYKFSGKSDLYGE